MRNSLAQRSQSSPLHVYPKRVAWMRCSRPLLVLLGLIATWLSAPAAAQTTAPGEALTRNDFSIDLVTGPIVGPNRVVSLGGAYTALGYGIDNAAITPAAYAARTLWDTHWFEWDVTLDYSPGAFRHTDFDNNGSSGFANSDFLFVTAGASVIAGDVGLGGLVRVQNYRIGKNADLQLIIANYGLCYALFDGQLLIGAAARTASLDITETHTHESLVSFTGTGPELGAILGPADRPFRIGLTLRTAVQPHKDNTTRTALGLTVPRRISLPAELQVGFAYQLGQRPLNRRWVNPHERDRDLRNDMLALRLARERAQARKELTDGRLRHALDTAPPPIANDLTDQAWLPEPKDPQFWQEEAVRRQHEERELAQRIAAAVELHRRALRALSRRYILLSAEALFIGETDAGVGLESFLLQRRQVSGKYASVAFRVGAEGEPIPNRVKLRVGSYLEPSRFAGVSPRVHGTVGLDLRLFAWDIFGLADEFDLRVTAMLDLAERYRNFGFSVGIWH